MSPGNLPIQLPNPAQINAPITIAITPSTTSSFPISGIRQFRASVVRNQKGRRAAALFYLLLCFRLDAVVLAVQPLVDLRIPLRLHLLQFCLLFRRQDCTNSIANPSALHGEISL